MSQLFSSDAPLVGVVQAGTCPPPAGSLGEGARWSEGREQTFQPSFSFSPCALTFNLCVPQGVVIAKKVNWVGCQGSEPHFRGFPCSLWVLFHFLTVQATRQNVDRSQEAGESAARAPPGLSLALSCPHWLPAAGPSLGDSDTARWDHWGATWGGGAPQTQASGFSLASLEP